MNLSTLLLLSIQASKADVETKVCNFAYLSFLDSYSEDPAQWTPQARARDEQYKCIWGYSIIMAN